MRKPAKTYISKLIIIVLLIFPFKTFGACGTTWDGAATWNGLNWGVGATRYTVGFAVDHGGNEYTVRAIPGFNCAPDDATWGTTYWDFVGACGSPPTLSLTTGAGSITCASATAGGTVDTDGDGSGITARGLAYHTASPPVIADNSVAEGGTTTGLFAGVTISGLLPNTLYYVRPFATNGNGLTGYGPEISFTTLALPTLAATTAATNITSISAETGGNITAAPCDITERGVVYNTATTPTIADSKVVEGGTTTGVFSATITGLSAGTKYYVRSYATTAGGTSYGAETWFYTGTLPTVTTSPDINVFCESFSTGGIGPIQFGRSSRPCCGVDALGDLYTSATEFGIIYGTNSADVTNSTPDALVGASVKDAHISVNAASLNQTLRYQEITGLSPSTTYYFKAYVTTPQGTGYGAVDNTTTSAPCAVYYSCSAVNTYDTDPACPVAGSTPTGTSIAYYRHDWRNVAGVALTDLNDITAETFVTAAPYRVVMSSGGYIYTDASYPAGAQLVVNAGSQFGFSGTPQLIVDGLTTPGSKFSRVTMNGGSFVSTAAITNNLKISGSGEFCNDGSFTNVSTAPGSVYDNYDANGGLGSTRYNDASCVGTFTLPVELIEFNVLKNSESVIINWKTGSEINNEYFEVQDSQDGRTWQTISIVQGAGNSTKINNYSILDDDITGYAIKYYRLKQADFDGTIAYSKIRSVNFNGNDDNTLYTYNNGTNIIVQINKTGIFDLCIYNSSGKLIHSEAVNNENSGSVVFIGRDKFADGLYLVRAISNNNVLSNKIIIR